ncbi:unnamed protein product [Phytomonas sp. EM1]|nr:unnamed protein product [Phytomonas sp. EM1]|eukprot:CCW59852.1 unnamed protein product [Phytomonas sp. isolate EM1]
MVPRSLHSRGAYRFFLGWPTLILTWGFIIWFSLTIWHHATSPVRFHDYSNPQNHFKIDPNWYFALWISTMPQLLFFCIFGMWVGWKFFRHN